MERKVFNWIQPLKHGVRQYDGEFSWERWIVFPRSILKSEPQNQEEWNEVLAELVVMMGWWSRNGEIGHRFAAYPCLRVGKFRLLMIQYRGWDV